MIYVVIPPRKFMIPLLEKLPELIICHRRNGRWEQVYSPAEIAKLKLHEFFMLSISEAYPSGDRFLLIHQDSASDLAEAFTSDDWDECLIWLTGRYSLAANRKQLEASLKLTVK